MQVKDKVVIITGGASGIGKASALSFAENGAKVVVVDYQAEAANQVATEISGKGQESLAFGVDVRDQAAVQAMVEQVVTKFGRIDVLINNAGVTRDGFLTKMSKEAWETVIDINLTGVFNCSQAVAKVMMEQGSGCIINATSVVGVYGNIGQTNYAATKAGVIGMTKSWAKELGRKGIRVNAVAPGFIQTPMTEQVPEKILTIMKEKTPLGCLGEPEDVAGAYLYLASDAAKYVNGTILHVDGGLVF